jgi:uncharacterized protein YkwD
MKYFLTLSLSFFIVLSSYNQTHNDFSDIEKLNGYLINEVNTIRKKAKVDSLENNSALEAAAKDHAMYMARKSNLTHNQRGNRLKHSPKNRADFYESGFAIVGENVQQLHISQVHEEMKKNKRIDDPYEALAKLLAENWRKSPPHYANMINPSYLFTITTIEIDEEGNIYACQLFGGSEFVDSYPKKKKEQKYKPVKEKKCKRSGTDGNIRVDVEGNIFFEADDKKESGFRWAFPWTEGIAADIVLKSQYPCDGNNSYHPEPGIKGIPLEPVYKKDFKKIGVWKKDNVMIPLGKVPDYIDEPYEVNLTIISRKRTCGNLSFNRIVSSVDIGLNLELGLKTKSPYNVDKTDSILSEKVYFQKSGVTFLDSIEYTSKDQLDSFQLDSTVLVGFASIEGDFERNRKLFEERTQNVKAALINKGFTDSLIFETAQENFTDFRRDIKSSLFEEWSDLEDKELKEKASQQPISDSLESILSRHRYVDIQHYYSRKDSVLFKASELESDFLTALKANNSSEAELAQLRLLQLVKMGHCEAPENLYDSIPRNRKFADLKYNFDLFYFEINRKKDFTKAVYQFMDSLAVLLTIDAKNKKAHSALAFFETMKIIQKGNPKEMYEWFYEIADNKLIEREFQARLLLEIAISNDLLVYYKQLEAPYLIQEASNYVRKARPNVSETFGLSAYFNFFGYTKYAFDLVKRVYLEAEKPVELAYFLGLVLYRNVDLNDNQKLRYFNQTAEAHTESFCKFFIDGSLNFQLFDNREYKNIYCQYCGE